MPKKFVTMLSVAAIAVVAAGYWLLSREKDSVPLSAEDATTREVDTGTLAGPRQNSTNGTPAFNAAPGSEGRERPPMGEAQSNAASVIGILRSVKLDENGAVVPDEMLKEALEEGFANSGATLTSAGMSELQSLIRSGLPGQAGQEVARMLDDYYRFRFAEIEFNEQPVHESPADHYERLVQLRRSYLGTATAEKLFAVEDANGRHMLAAIAIQTNASLPDQEKHIQQAALQEKLSDRLLSLGLVKPEEAAAEKVQRLREQGASSTDIYATRSVMLGAQGALELAAADREEANWQSRFNEFWQARRYVMQAGLDEGDRERQIEQLLEQHFNAEERERARLTSFDWQARDPK